MIPSTRDEKVQWVQENLLPIPESKLAGPDPEELDEELHEQSKKILAEELLDETSGFFFSVFKLAVILIFIDAFTFMPPQVYGLIFTTTGTYIMLVETDILGSKRITRLSKESSGATLGGSWFLNETKARRLARNTVHTNIGLVWMTLGFLMQIIAVWLIPSETLIGPLL